MAAANCCYTCLLRNPFPWVAALGCLLAFCQSQDFGVSTIFLTSSVLILYLVIILCRSKPCEQKTKQALREESNTSTLQEGESETAEEEEEQDSVADKNERQKDEKRTGDECVVRSSAEVLLSDSESVDHTTTSSEDYSENDSMFRENLSHSTNYSDGSISDEESLIEIVLPTGHYDCSSRFFQRKWPDCSLQSHFRQQNWTEMQNEMNDENFIEIDICMGSIKCSRFEIQA